MDIFNDIERDTIDVLGERSTNPMDKSYNKQDLPTSKMLKTQMKATMGEDLRLDYKSRLTELEKSEKQIKRTLTTEKHSLKYVDAKIEQLN